MSRRSLLPALFLCASLAAAQAGEAPSLRARLDSAFAAQLGSQELAALGQDASFERTGPLLKEMSRRRAVRVRLQEIEPGVPPVEAPLLARAYLAAGFADDAKRLLASPPAKAVGGEAARLLAAGRNEAAAEAARRALALDPKDQAAWAVLKLSERRLADQKLRLPEAGRPDLPVPAGAGGPGLRLARLSGSAPAGQKSVVPISGYHSPETVKPGALAQFVFGMDSLADVLLHRSAGKENAAFRELRGRLDAVSSGAELVRDMGGWDAIDRTVHFNYEDLPSKGTLAYVRPLLPWETLATGKRYALIMSRELLGAPPETAAPIFAHELSHVRDHMRGDLADPRLAVTSEHGAHLRQVYVFQELEKKSSPERLAALRSDRLWMSQKWLASLWEDRILSRYPTRQSYQDLFKDSKKLRYLAGLAYEDVYKKTVADGTPQVFYHVSDLYAAATSETETTEAELERRIQQGALDRQALETRLKRLRAMRASTLQADADYRRRTGQTLP